MPRQGLVESLMLWFIDQVMKCFVDPAMPWFIDPAMVAHEKRGTC
jgi:hypothetical protein